MLAQQTGLTPRELIWSGGDVHLYRNHAELVTQQLARVPGGDPRLALRQAPSSLFDYTIDDFFIRDYAPQEHIRAPVAV